jgi:hypothetical protein
LKIGSQRRQKNKEMLNWEELDDQKDKFNDSLHIGDPTEDPPIFEFNNEFTLEDNYQGAGQKD